jgi:hypothetical protein
MKPCNTPSVDYDKLAKTLDLGKDAVVQRWRSLKKKLAGMNQKDYENTPKAELVMLGYL